MNKKVLKALLLLYSRVSTSTTTLTTLNLNVMHAAMR
jgi:hypothetical protein